MAVTLAKLVANRAKAEIDFGGGDVLHVEFYPAKLTGKMLQAFAAADRIQDLSAEQGVAVTLSATDTLLVLLASWDLADDDGAIIPIDREHLEPLGLPIQWAILARVMTAGADGKAGEASAPGAAKS